MAKKNVKQLDSKKLINTILLGLAAFVTVAGIFFIWFACAQPWKIGTVSEMKSCEYSNYLTQKGVKEDSSSYYYLYIYTSEENKRDDWYDAIVTEYANYARLHSTARPIYAYDLAAKGNSKIQDKLGTITVGKDIPGLVLIKDGAISTKMLSWTKLSNELTSQMNK